MTVLPSLPTFPAGTVPFASDYVDLTTLVQHLLTPPLAILTRGAAQTVANATYAAVAFDGETIDRGDGHSLVTNPGRYTAQTAGWYAASGTICWASNVTGLRILNFWINGVLQNNGSAQIPTVTTGGSGTNITGAATFYLGVNDYIDLRGYQTSGGNLDMLSGFLHLLWVSS